MPSFLIISNEEYYPSTGLKDVVFISMDFDESRKKYIDILESKQFQDKLYFYQIQDDNILIYDLYANKWIDVK